MVAQRTTKPDGKTELVQVRKTPKFEEFITLKVKPSNFMTRIASRKLRRELTDALTERVTAELGAEAAALAVQQIHQLLSNTESLEALAPLDDYPPLQQMVALWTMYSADTPDFWAIFKYYAMMDTSVETLWVKVIQDQINKRDRQMLDMLAPRALKPGEALTDEEQENEDFLAPGAPSSTTSGSG